MNHKNILLTTVYISLFIQIFTGGLDIYALTLRYSTETLILKSLIWMETIVQLIEGIFYVWLVKQFHFIDIENITSKRYVDWFITTPTMLFALCIYLDYLRNINKENIQNQLHQSNNLLKINHTYKKNIILKNKIKII